LQPGQTLVESNGSNSVTWQEKKSVVATKLVPVNIASQGGGECLYSFTFFTDFTEMLLSAISVQRE